MTEDTVDPASDAAQAFEDLRAEVLVMRRAMETLPGAWQENQPPDYSPDLGRIAKGLTVVAAQLDDINKHPALRMTPEQHRQAIAQASNGLIREAVEKLDRATYDVERERQQLANLIGVVRDKRDQRFWLIAIPVMIAFVTLLASPVLLGWLPFGLPSQAAALIMNEDRWDAGQTLMSEASPDSYEKMVTLYNTCGRQSVEFCTQAIAAKTIDNVGQESRSRSKSRSGP
jgi:hypothetical protein